MTPQSTPLVRGAAALAAVALSALLLVPLGCRSGGSKDAKASGPPAMAPSAEELVEQARRDLRRQYGEQARVGYVASGGQRVVIGGLDTSGLRADETFLFVDANRNPVALGRVADADSQRVTATWDATVIDNGRPPREGDLAAFKLAAGQ